MCILRFPLALLLGVILIPLQGQVELSRAINWNSYDRVSIFVASPNGTVQRNLEPSLRALNILFAQKGFRSRGNCSWLAGILSDENDPEALAELSDWANSTPSSLYLEICNEDNVGRVSRGTLALRVYDCTSTVVGDRVVPISTIVCKSGRNNAENLTSIVNFLESEIPFLQFDSNLALSRARGGKSNNGICAYDGILEVVDMAADFELEWAQVIDYYNAGEEVSSEVTIPEKKAESIDKEALKENIMHHISSSPVHGIYRTAPGSPELCGRYEIAITTNEDEISGVIYEQKANWLIGEKKCQLTPTAAEVFFICDWVMSNKSVKEVYAMYDSGILTIQLDEECPMIKTFPLLKNNGNASENTPSGASGDLDMTLSGSGSAVIVDAQSGYLVTNYHVASAGKKLRMVYRNEEFEVVVTATDESNDLALLRILDAVPSGLKSLPISINDQIGDRIVTAGYPLKGVMGSDIKVTEGIISSTSYLGSSNMYQISAPITNGNSGGALLDETGNLAGITQGGYRPDANTENVNAAVKSLMVLSLTQGESDCNPLIGDLSEEIPFTTLENSVVPVNVYN